ncbi:E3 ubiquitin-protein ligase NHLRC1 [Tachyglossus aculeatus]|uniref:E3 ubiquitin-protein ligase NHLRC1 n=1 Tax=Tachyglossus aculeatus TaxID=9261 RepID=UPI0018F3B2A0|nr:E3 ubiquitin-protein ligase NHLRC1 [Tachyglossus aculeatus]
MEAGPSDGGRETSDPLREAQARLLECQVCFEKHGACKERRPRNLPCGHVICLECVVALAHPETLAFLCPFCRRPCKSSDTSDCLPLLQLLEILAPRPTRPPGQAAVALQARPRAPGPLVLRRTFGGWGTLLNPTGMALGPRDGRVVVVHNGRRRVSVFDADGARVRQFGERGEAGGDVRYALDVAVTPDGCVVVTDAGARAVKGFDPAGRPGLVVRAPFRLPWGVAAAPRGAVLVTDLEAGALFLLQADVAAGTVLEARRLRAGLLGPRGVAVSSRDGAVAVLERGGPGLRVKVFSASMRLLGQVDPFGLSLLFPAEMSAATAVTFDPEGNIVIADALHGAVVSLGRPGTALDIRPLVTRGLSHPVALAYSEDKSLLVLDGGAHSVAVFKAS